jgi:hypothetical protein
MFPLLSLPKIRWNKDDKIYVLGLKAIATGELA